MKQHVQRIKYALKRKIIIVIFRVCEYLGIRNEFLFDLSCSYLEETFFAVLDVSLRYPNKLTTLQKLLSTDKLPPRILQCFEDANFATLCHGQEGEDLLLKQLLRNQASGFFVDVGAHHPVRFSNTYALYRSGWRGINIDATPGSMQAFNTLRPGDVNIETVVSDSVEPLTFYVFEEGALNTLDERLAQEYIDTGWPLREQVELTPQPLSGLFDAHVPAGMQIDVMSVDVEEHELHVLQSNNWKKYQPTIIIVEILDVSMQSLAEHPVAIFLRAQGYRPCAFLCRTVFFVREQGACVES